MSLTPSRKPSSSQRRRSVGTGGGSGRYSQSETSSTNTYPGRIRAAEGHPTVRTYPTTPRRQVKQTACSDNHGIKPPTPEQYLTPLQQKEVCIRHLRARLRDNVERLQHRDFEIEELRTQLFRMQEDWIEEECHRVEAQLALKEARREIQHLQGVVESVRANLGVPEQGPHEHKPYSGLWGPRPVGKSQSCGCSPANTLSRSTTRNRLSSEALQLEHSVHAAEPSRGSCISGQTHLLEAAVPSEQLPSQGLSGGPSAVLSSSNFERLYSRGAVLPMSHSCHTLSSSYKCDGPTYLPHHHLFLHLPQEEVPVPTSSAATTSTPIPTPAAEKKPEVRSQACSPTMTWLCEDSAGEELSIISLATVDIITPSIKRQFPTSLPPSSHSEIPEELHTKQPHPVMQPPVSLEVTALETEENTKEESQSMNEDGYSSQLGHWSSSFLVDLLALAMPVVPTMAWLCRGGTRDVMPVYQIGSLLRGCCAVALHSLRRQNTARPTSMNGTPPI
ncbi:syntaphilin [Thalassophryne amazonica]|uniref:syntaphilin n=1 Tax=Thalassophryne amazonica TaxID=390379 RepID=UPI001471692E|nr:syntaphilin [Thalassophryne amazonica]